jgi:hypothetical protein
VNLVVSQETNKVMTQSRKVEWTVLVISVVTVFVAGIYFLYVKLGAFTTMALAIFATIPLSLFIPVAAVRYAILGAWIGAFIGFIPNVFFSLLLMDSPEVRNTIGPLFGPVFHGGGALICAAIGVSIAMRKRPQ